MAEFVANAGKDLELWRVHIDEVREQDVNARVMNPDQFERLTENIQKEARMESLIFAVQRGEKFELISGHHRLRAARQAGVHEMLILADTRDLSRSAVVAKQLAHNALAGEDDPDMLRALVSEIESLDDLLETGLDEEFLDSTKLKPVTFEAPEVEFQWKYVTLVFLPAQMKRFEELIEIMPDADDMVGVCDAGIYAKFCEVTQRLGKVENIRSIGTLVSRMLEISLEYVTDAEDVAAIEAAEKEKKKVEREEKKAAKLKAENTNNVIEGKEDGQHEPKHKPKRKSGD